MLLRCEVFPKQGFISKELLHIVGQSFWLFFGSKVAALFHHCPLLYVVESLSPVLWHAAYFLREHSNACGDLHMQAVLFHQTGHVHVRLKMLGAVTTKPYKQMMATWLSALAGDFMATTSRFRLQACYHGWD